MNSTCSNPCRASGPRHDDGFTILEMLVALSITALLASLMVATLSQLRPLVTHVRIAGDRHDLIALADYLEALLKQTRRRPLIESHPNGKTIFMGDEHRMRFVTVARVGSDQAALREVELAATVIDGKWMLEQMSMPRRFRPIDPVKPVTVIEGLETIRFEYLAVREDGVAEWRASWTEGDGVPSAVKLLLANVGAATPPAYQRVIVMPRR